MPARSGQRAERTGTFHCRGCDEAIRVRKGELIPACPCGGNTFQSRTHELGTRPGKRSKKGTLKAKARASAGANRVRATRRRAA